MKIVINSCFGGFGLSDAAYEKLIEYGIPVKKYIEQKQNLKTGLYEQEPQNDGQAIFDRTLTPGDQKNMGFMGRYWETWLDGNRTHPYLIRVIEKLGAKANGRCAKLSIIKIPDGIEYEITEYDGFEKVEEKHRSWS